MIIKFTANRELEEQIITAGKVVGVVLDLDWIAEGALNLLNEMVTNTCNLTPSSSISPEVPPGDMQGFAEFRAV